MPMPSETVSEPSAPRQRVLGPLTFGQAVAIIVVIGLVVRLAYVVYLRHVGNFMVGDSYVYHREGQQLANGQGWINPLLMDHFGIRRQLAMHPPAYSLWLAWWSWLGLTSTLAHQLVTIPIGLGSIVVLGIVGRRLWSPRVGLVAALVAALHPSIWSWEGMILQEPMAILATGLLLWAMLAFLRDRSRRTMVLAGLAAGFAPLTRAELLSAVGLCFVIILVAHRDRHTLFRLAGAGAIAVLVILPWSIHNTLRFSKVVPLSNGLGVTMASTHCDSLTGETLGYWSMTCAADAATKATAEWLQTHPDAESIDIDTGHLANPLDTSGSSVFLAQRVDLRYPALNEAVVDSLMLKDTLRWIEHHPKYMLKSVPARIGRVLGVYRPLQQMRLDTFPEGRKRPVVLGAWAMYYLLLPFVLIGGWRLWRRSRAQLLILLAPACSALLAVAMTFGNTRYRAIAEPTMALLAAIGLATVWAWFRGTWREGATAGSNQSLESAVSTVG